mmetsp:Transcript_26976/g.76952  ORF Transcript_26976/g.76952 Transcript_26976/m.76952 type:complete len:246 (-) Transcript_26976:346-1083(-)
MFLCWQPTIGCAGPQPSSSPFGSHLSRSPREIIAALSQPSTSWQFTTCGSSPSPISVTPPLHSLLKKRMSVRLPKSSKYASVGRRFSLMIAEWLSISSPANDPFITPDAPTSAQVERSMSRKPSCFCMSTTANILSRPSPPMGSVLLSAEGGKSSIQKSYSVLSSLAQSGGFTNALRPHVPTSVPRGKDTPSHSGSSSQRRRHSLRATVDSSWNSFPTGNSCEPRPSKQFVLMWSVHPSANLSTF